MPTICFFPWLTLAGGLRTKDFALLPYTRAVAPMGPGTIEQETVDLLLEPYRHVPKLPVRRATLLQIDGRSVIDKLDDAEADQALRYGEMVAFAGLAARRYFDALGYTNRDTFRLIVQRFTDASSGLGVIARRRDGTAKIGVSREALLVQKPYHVSTPSNALLDVPLLEALVNRASMEDWGEFEESILGFNAASTDSPDIREESEAVAILGSLERLLGLRGGKEHELADAFLAAIEPAAAIAPSACPRIVGSPQRGRYTSYPSTSEAWIRDFFRIRNEHAHGKIAPRYTSVWTLREHLLLASFVFPLVAKARLLQSGCYAWTEHDRVAIDTFEELACATPFEAEQEEQEVGDEDADEDAPRRWGSILSQAKTRRALAKWIEHNPHVFEATSSDDESDVEGTENSETVD